MIARIEKIEIVQMDLKLPKEVLDRFHKRARTLTPKSKREASQIGVCETESALAIRDEINTIFC